MFDQPNKKLLHEKHDMAERLFRNIALDLAALVESVPRLAANWIAESHADRLSPGARRRSSGNKMGRSLKRSVELPIAAKDSKLASDAATATELEHLYGASKNQTMRPSSSLSARPMRAGDVRVGPRDEVKAAVETLHNRKLAEPTVESHSTAATERSLESLDEPEEDELNCKMTDRDLQLEFSIDRDQSILQEVVCLVKRRRWSTAKLFLTENFM